MISRGTGFPVAVIPGIQGRWEWMTPTIDALAAGHRVITWSLTDLRPERRSDGDFLEWMRPIDRALDATHERRVSLIGVSFGGLIAACYAARRPERVAALILASTPSPVWEPRPGDEFCLRFPWLAFPYFAARALRRLLPEIYHARNAWPQRAQLGAEHFGRAFRSPFAPGHAAQWVREWKARDITGECARIVAPTLVVTGERHLEHVVPVERTLQYTRLIPGAEHVVLAGTGHLGVITQPHRFAEIAGQFIHAANAAERSAPAADATSQQPRARYAS
ncbi:MAG TPA: alpha/beta hydrolase [Vicinamibacterales bacterium]|nr:alpha/beta hydrolase [Vicinamibacterales bacterium]